MDTEYILTCAYELGEMTALEATIMGQATPAYEAVRALVDADCMIPTHFFENTTRQYLASVDEDEAHFWHLHALEAVPFGLRALDERLNAVVQFRAQEDLGIRERPFAGLLRDDSPTRLALVPPLTRESDLSEAWVSACIQAAGEPLFQRWHAQLTQTKDAVEWFLADAGQRYFKVAQRLQRKPALRDELASEPMQSVSALAMKAWNARRKEEARKARGLVRQARSAIKKAARLFDNLGHSQTLKLLISGQTVEVYHPDSPFKFVVQAPQSSGWLVERTQQVRGHTPFDLQLFTKDGMHLARLCVYFDQTPVLDQLLALTMFVQTGDELKLLSAANWFGLTDWDERKQHLVVDRYPELACKLPRLRAPGDSAAVWTDSMLIDTVFHRQQAHWEPYRGRVQQWVRQWMLPLTQDMTLIQGHLPAPRLQLSA